MSSPVCTPEPGSFQDRSSRIVYLNDQVYRILNQQAADNWQQFKTTRCFQNALTNAQLVQTEDATNTNLTAVFPEIDTRGVLQHERIPVVSYPYEWSFGMLKDAALLHLNLLNNAISDNFMIKDATAYNVQWQGARPVFIDIPSFEPLEQGKPWAGYRQFCQMFLYPLMLMAYKNIPFHAWMRGSIQGIEPQAMAPLFSVLDYVKPGVLPHVILHAKLQQQYATPDKQQQLVNSLQNEQYAKALIVNNVKGLTQLIEKLTWQQSVSTWSAYAANNSYTSEESQDKIKFIETAISNRRWQTTWDIGCNTGTFSKLASKYSDTVLALDADHLSVEHLYQHLKASEYKNILPMVMNLADPSPALGWQGLERKSLPQRSQPELILALALIHHMVISHNIPVRDFIDWLGGLKSHLIIEFVTKDDPMVKTLLMNKADQYDDYNQAYFEKCLRHWYHIEKQETSRSGTRILYFLSPLN